MTIPAVPFNLSSIGNEFGFGFPFNFDRIWTPAGAGAAAPRDFAAFAGFTQLQFSGGAVQNLGLLTPDVTDFTVTASPIGGAGGYSYSWEVISNNGGSTCVIASPTAQSTTVGTGAFGTYIVGCTVTDAWGSQRLCEFEATTQAPAGSNPGGGGGNCVVVGSFLSDGQRAGRVRVGDSYEVLTADFAGTELAPVTGFSKSIEPCVRLTSTSGVQLECSRSTPIEWPGGRVLAAHSLGAPISVKDEDGFRWERVAKVESIGMMAVANISFDERIYGAGAISGKLLFTHNKVQP